METLLCAPVSAAASQPSVRPAIASLFEIAGRRVLFEPKGATLPGFAELLAGYYCTALPLNGKPDAIIRLSVSEFSPDIASTFDRFDVSGGGVGYTDGRTFVFDFKDSRIIVGPDQPPQIDVWMRKELDLQRADELQVLNYALSIALRRCAVYELHSGAVVEPHSQRGVLFIGPSGSGKSTLTLQLVANGWQYLTDDVLLLQNVGGLVKAYPLRRAFVITHSTVVASGLEVREAFAKVDWSNGFKKPFMPNDFFPESFSASCQPQAIFFPAITNEEQSVVRPLTQSETMIRLIKLCPWSCYDSVSSSGHLEALAALAKQCNGFLLFAGQDLLRDPATALKLVQEHTNSSRQ